MGTKVCSGCTLGNIIDASCMWCDACEAKWRGENNIHIDEVEAPVYGIEDEIKSLTSRLKTLTQAAQALRDAQHAYMAKRGNQELGKAVAVKGRELDTVLVQCGLK